MSDAPTRPRASTWSFFRQSERFRPGIFLMVASTIIAGLSTWVSLPLFYEELRYVTGGVVVPATVHGSYQFSQVDADLEPINTQHFVAYRFRTEDGAMVLGRAEVDADFNQGAKIDVAYVEDDPDQSRLANATGWWPILGLFTFAFIPIALTFIAQWYAWHIASRAAKLVRSGRSARVPITALREQGRGRYRYLEYAIAVEGAEPVKGRGPLMTRRRLQLNVGDEITVYYDPEDPSRNIWDLRSEAVAA